MLRRTVIHEILERMAAGGRGPAHRGRKKGAVRMGTTASKTWARQNGRQFMPHLSYSRLLFRLSVVVLALGMMLALQEYARPAAIANIPDHQSIKVSSSAISYDDRMEITLAGLPPEYTLPASAVLFAGIRVPLPGYFGHPGEKPQSDGLGNLTFTAPVPAGVPLGSQPLTVDLPPVFLVSATVEFLGASLAISPATAVGNQTVMVSGSGFAPAPVKGRSQRTETLHRITGRGSSVVTVGGEVLGPLYVEYPINLDKHGNFFARVTLPVDMPFSNFLSKWGIYGRGAGDFATPTGVAVDGSGNIYVSEKDGHRIQKFDPAGKFLTKWGSYGAGDGEFSSPVAIAVDTSGNVYVADSGNHRVQKFDSSGKFLGKWGKNGIADGEFITPNGIAVGGSGYIYVSQRHGGRIQKFSSSGKFLAKWGIYGTGDGEFSSPVGIAVDQLGNVYVADWGNRRIQKFDVSGGFLAKWGSFGSEAGEFVAPGDLAVDGSGNIYVLDRDGRRVQKFDSSGKFLGKWGSLGSGDGQFGSPMGIAVDRSGNVYVADSGNHRIQKFDSSMKKGILDLRVTDSGGRTGSVYLSVHTPSVVFDPPSGYPGEMVRIHGRAFTATNPASGIENGVRIDYRLVEKEGLPSQYYVPGLSKNATVDGFGNFDAEFEIPPRAKIPSGNLVSISPEHGRALDVVHKVSIPSIAFEPSSVFPSEQVKITIKGLTSDLKLPVNIATLGGMRLPVPGYRDSPGPIPKTDRTGSVTFSSVVPKTVPAGLQHLEIRLAGGRWLRSNVTVLTTALEITPAIAAPGQIITVKALDLCPASDDAPGPFGNHQITGDQVSRVTLGGKRVGTPQLVYPLGLDVQGRLFFPLKVPVSDVTLRGGSLDVRLADTCGRTGAGTVTLKMPRLTVSPATSIRGSVVEVMGDGFVASDLSGPSRYPIDVKYAGRLVATAEPDRYGSFNVRFKVPSDAAIKSPNVVSAKVRKLSFEAKSFHRVPGAHAVVGTPSVQMFDSSGDFSTRWGGYGIGDGEFVIHGHAPAERSAIGVAVDKSGTVYVTDSGNHRVQKFDSSGKFLTKWGNLGTRDGEFVTPNGIAVDGSGNIYVSEENGDRVQKFDSSGKFLTKWGGSGIGEGEFRSPAGVAVDPSGNVYVADSDNDRVQKFNSSGKFLTKWGGAGSGNGQFRSPAGVGVDASGNVFVADSGNHRVQRFTSSGLFLSRWGSYGTGDGKFVTPSGIAVDGSRNIYVAEENGARVQKFDSSGNFLDRWGLRGIGNGAFSSPMGVAVDKSGAVYVADSGNHRVQIFDSSGAFLTKLGRHGSKNGEFGKPEQGATANPTMSLTVDESGNLYVADSGNHRVQKFDPSGKFLAKWGTLGTGDGEFVTPSGIAVDGSGNVYVSEGVGDRIQKFDPYGKFLTKWGGPGIGDGEFDSPVGVAVDKSGDVHVVDQGNNRLQKFDSSGKFLTKWGGWGIGDGEFKSPVGVAVDTSGSVFVADAGNHRVQMFDSSGKFLSKFGGLGSGDGKFLAPEDIAVDGSGNVSVSDKVGRRLQKFDPSGKFLGEWGRYGIGSGEFSSPSGVALDESGNMYVADSGSPRVPRGEEVAITGTGYLAFQRVWISVAGQRLSRSGIHTDVNGAFTAVFAIPQGIPLGALVVSAITPSRTIVRVVVTVTAK